MRGGKRIKAVIPGGSYAPVVPGVMMMASDMDYDSIAKAGSMLGSGAVIVMDETRCMVRSLLRLSYFYFEESCGQCTPCREGTGWLYRMVNRIEHGEGRQEDLDLLNNVAENIMGRTICALGDAAAMPVRGMLKHYWKEFEYHVEHKQCMVPAYI
jgi:NADH-quinone oxidoreductase subunit F